MPLQKNQVLTLTIERLSNDGSGVAHSPDGEAVFIPGTAPGDVAAIFDDADGGNVTGGGAGYEHSLAVRAASNAAAIVGQALNGQGQHLIFL